MSRLSHSLSADSGIKSVSDIFEESFHLEQEEWVGFRGKPDDDEEEVQQVMNVPTAEPFALVYKHWESLKL